MTLNGKKISDAYVGWFKELIEARYNLLNCEIWEGNMFCAKKGRKTIFLILHKNWFSYGSSVVQLI